jgi:hypothetical protein
MKGQLKYIPKELLEELNSTRIQLNIDNDADCFRVIARNNSLAKELKFNLDFDLGRRKKRK